MGPKETFITLAIILINTQKYNALNIKINARPVYETLNEQARSDDRIVITKTPVLPYGNPLAGNSKQNARLHAQNQQAMFNAERMRQHKAQLQRWMQTPPRQMDSYMKAYHESQENHQISLERQESDLRALPLSPPLNRPERKRKISGRKHPQLDVGFQVPELTPITKSDAIRSDNQRIHRSYGSAYQQYLQSKGTKTVNVSPGPTYDQGVTIKPNGNVGVANVESQTESTKLYTEAISSANVYPKQYNQMQGYQSANDISALNSLLKKPVHDQLTELNAMLNTKNNQKPKNVVNSPIDPYFYIKNAPKEIVAHSHQPLRYTQVPHYPSSHHPQSIHSLDYIPITEEFEDIEDPNMYRHQPIATAQPDIDTTTTKSNNYYKIEVASQTFSGYNPLYQFKPETSSYNKEQDEEPIEVLQYAQPIQNYEIKDYNDDISQKYLHHNGQHFGVQHLNDDGTGISAYGDDNLHYASNYEFGYRVRDIHSGNDFGHQEAKVGDSTEGKYHVLLPDGRLQKVIYSAGPEGFHADISYDHLLLEKK